MQRRGNNCAARVIIQTLLHVAPLAKQSVYRWVHAKYGWKLLTLPLGAYAWLIQLVCTQRHPPWNQCLPWLTQPPVAHGTTSMWFHMSIPVPSLSLRFLMLCGSKKKKRNEQHFTFWSLITLAHSAVWFKFQHQHCKHSWHRDEWARGAKMGRIKRSDQSNSARDREAIAQHDCWIEGLCANVSRPRSNSPAVKLEMAQKHRRAYGPHN